MLCCSNNIAAQTYYTLKGQIFDEKNKLTLPQAHVITEEGSGSGVVADMDGNYIISLQKPKTTLIFKYLGYKSETVEVSFDKNETVKTLNVGLASIVNALGAVKITASKYNADSKTSIQTLEVVGLQHIDRTNATTLDKALGNVAGLAIVDNEPQMRGGSGYSSGMGSRVMILLDEMPILRADAGRPAWNLIPMEDVSQIEVLKGASSVLFGSAAINGAINVRTAYAKNEPETKFKLYTGIYSKPNGLGFFQVTDAWGTGVKPEKTDYAPWTTDIPLTFGASLSHSRRIKQKTDLVFSVEYASNDGYRGPDTKLDLENRKNELVHQESRIRANVGVQHRFNEKWIVSLNGNFMYSDNNMFNFWNNANEGLYRAYEGTISNFKDLIFFIDPHIKYIHSKGGIHTFDSRLMYSNNQVVNIDNQDAYSRSMYNVYQYRKSFKKADDLTLVAGASNQYTYSFGEVFSGDMIGLELPQGSVQPRKNEADNLALFGRLEKKFLKEDNLSLELGVRWEMAMVNQWTDSSGSSYKDRDYTQKWSESSPVFQFGINYEIPKTHTIFRASVGQGYRAATIGERFITTKVGSYGFYPNPDLKSERSISFEVAARQMFKIGAVEGFFDVAGFHQIYDNYIEFFMGPWNPYADKEFDKFGFKFFNTGRANISGLETTLALQADVADILNIQMNANYTYSLPVCKEPDFVYATLREGIEGEHNYTYMNSSSNTEGHILKYRIQHMAKLDLNFTFIEKFTIGFGVMYFSSMKNVDNMFVKWDKYAPDAGAWLKDLEVPFEGTYDFMEKHKKGSLVFDLRFNVQLKHLGIALIINNLFNSEYSLRPMCIEAPRLTTLQLTYKFVDINPATWFKKREKADI